MRHKKQSRESPLPEYVKKAEKNGRKHATCRKLFPRIRWLRCWVFMIIAFHFGRFCTCPFRFTLRPPFQPGQSKTTAIARRSENVQTLHHLNAKQNCRIIRNHQDSGKWTPMGINNLVSKKEEGNRKQRQGFGLEVQSRKIQSHQMLSYSCSFPSSI